MQIVTVAQIREIERAADEAGLSYAELMQNAGLAAAAEIRRRLPTLCATVHDRAICIVVLVGPGNNGGDGLVCAQALHEAVLVGSPRLDIQVYCLKQRSNDDPVYRAAVSSGVPITSADADAGLSQLGLLLARADVVIDALLGTGVARPVDGVLAVILNALKQTSGRTPRPGVVALDGVTGMNYDTGALDPASPSADLTITFHAPKRGHFGYPAARANGELVIVPIGIQPQHLAQLTHSVRDQVVLADADLVRQLLPTRRPDANKGSSGRVLVVGGCADYSGAPTLAATAAYRVGAGLVTLAVPRAIQTSAAILCREATFLSSQTYSDFLAPDALGRIATMLDGLDQRHAVVVGPGIGQNPQTGAFLEDLLDLARVGINGVRIVMDADGLNHLSQHENWPQALPPLAILTPHPGEMVRLTGMSIQAIQADRIGTALRCAQQWGHVVVLKGAFTVIAAPEKGAVVLPFSNAALAVAGTGDVLAGCVGGMLAQGLAPMDAAVCGAFVHATSGELWRTAHGDAGLLAGDLLTLLPDVIKSLRRPIQ